MKKFLSALFFLLATSLTAFSQNTFPVRFAHGTEVFPENFAIARQTPNVSADELVNDFFVRYVQLEKIMNAKERAAFEATGARIVGYVQFGAYLVLLPQNFDFQKIEAFSPRSIVPVKPDWKLAKSLRKQPYGAWAVRGDHIDINVQLYPNILIAEGASLCISKGLEVIKEGSQNGLIQIRVHQDKIGEVAAFPFVQYLELVPPPGEKEDTRGRSLHRSNLVASDAPLGKKYDGTGVNTLVRDDGTVGPHIDFKGRLDNLASLNGAGGHGDLVAGCIGGAGNLNPTAKGMASGAFIYVTNYEADFQDETMSIIQNKGVTLTNTSYTDGFNAGYTLNAQTVDQQLYSNPNLTHIFSAGNANDDNVDYGYGAGTQWGNITGGHKMAKNAVTVASLLSDGTISGFSSRGPATDGRLKPDISAFGEGVFMTQPDNTYEVNSGTSFSAPSVAGCFAQLTHAYRTIHNGSEIPSALLKVSAYNTANDLGNIGPDYKFGWGHINTWRALRLLEQNQWLEGNVDQSGDIGHTLQIPSGVKEAKIMIYWAEPPSAENAAKTLINDLDLVVNASSGTAYLPWKLNPTPNPVILDTPAGKGRDSLNNVEQVLIENPVAGIYTIHVKGTEVPMGPQHYYIVWEFIKDEIKVTYPAGGEGFVPGEVERIHWDASGNTGTFTLRYSTDGGNSFLPLASVGGDRRMYDWTVPNIVSGKVHVLVLRGTKRDTSDYPTSIVGVPQNIQVAKVCPDTMWLSWIEVNDTLSYDAYLLGNKYMEIQGTTSSNSIGFPIQFAGNEKWVSVRTSHPDGMAGRRANAIRWPGQLLNCPQPYDLAVQQMLSPSGDAFIACEASDLSIAIQVKNEGLNASTGATAFYQVNNDPPVSEVLPDIPSGESLSFTFQVPVNIVSNGVLALKTWVNFPGDIANFNDTLSSSFPVVVEAVNQFFVENFEANPGFPLGWVNVDPDADNPWVTTDVLPAPVIGPDGLAGRSVHFDYYSYGPNLEGNEDYLYMIPIDLAGLSNPALTFDLAHSEYDATYVDSLRVEVFSNCDLASTPVTIWGKKDPDLATVPARTNYYYAESAEDWRTESVDLNAFAGQKIIVRFVSVNGYGNSLYLDNIGITEYVVPVLPVAEFAAPDSICRLDTLVFEATPSTDDASYAWNFGLAAIPSQASGIGPHSVIYPTPGNKTVRLIVENSFGRDTMIRIVTVRPLATANFTVSQTGLTATFTNTSTNASSYLWDFGDGMTSTFANPIHTYASAGTYQVTLSATNECRTNQKTTTVGVTSLSDLSGHIGIRILPNPTEGDFAVELNSRIVGNVQLVLFDAAGRMVKAQEALVKQGISQIEFENLNLPKGLYQLNVQVDGKQSTFSVAVQ